jgi:hypothetical protein
VYRGLVCCCRKVDPREHRRVIRHERRELLSLDVEKERGDNNKPEGRDAMHGQQINRVSGKVVIVLSLTAVACGT